MKLKIFLPLSFIILISSSGCDKKCDKTTADVRDKIAGEYDFSATYNIDPTLARNGYNKTPSTIHLRILKDLYDENKVMIFNLENLTQNFDAIRQGNIFVIKPQSTGLEPSEEGFESLNLNAYPPEYCEINGSFDVNGNINYTVAASGWNLKEVNAIRLGNSTNTKTVNQTIGIKRTR